MRGKQHLRPIVALCLLAISILLLSAAGPLAAETNAFSLTLNVSPPGSGTATAAPSGPYNENDVVTLTASPSAGFVFDKWVLADDNKWWDAGWDYRVGVTAAAAGYARQNKPAEFQLNFTQLWNSLGASGALDPNSIRVVEVDGNGNVIDDSVPFQFDAAKDFNASTKAAGTLVLIMEGNTGAGATRRYHVYFDKTGKGFPAPNVPAQVVLTDGVTDESIASLRIVTPNSTLFLHKAGGGLSSLNDVNGNDWISWNSAPDSAGAYRGIPNAAGGSNSGLFHPGLGGKMVSTVLNSGPIKATVHVIETSAPQRTKWEGMYEFYPGYTTFTMINASVSAAVEYKFYFLYEGTPGGKLDPATDFVVLSNGQQITAGQSRNGDLPDEEWSYIADPNVGASGRAIFLINHKDDIQNDSYAPDGKNLMTIMGFGRNGATPNLLNNSTPRKFSFGLMDETQIDNAKPIIYNTYRDLTVNVGAAEGRSGASLGSQNPVQFTITGEHTITAQFKPAQYTVTTNVSPEGTGTVTKTPNKATYNNGEEVTLTATATAPGYNFAGWQGDASGTSNTVKITVTKNMVVTAVFAQSFTITTSANPAEGGTVTLNPPGPYQPGAQVTISAVANNGYTFINWSGDLNSLNPVENVVVNGNLTIVANFGQPQYTFNATSAGNGSVDWEPKKAAYAPGEVVTVTATAATGYVFSNWSGSISSQANPLVIPILANTTVIGNFIAAETYTVDVTVPGGGGTVTKSPPGPNYPAGEVVTLSAVPDSGKRFVSWGGDASGTDPQIEIEVTANLSITATFADDGHPVNVTLVPPQGGAVTKNPNQAFYAVGTVVTLTAVANTGWTFTGWSGDIVDPNPTTVVTVEEGGIDVVATFTAPGPFVLNVTTTGNGTGSVTINPVKTEYFFGETVKLTAVPGLGSVFAGWSGDATGNKNPITLTMDNDKNVVANFIVPSGPFSDNFDSCSLSPRWGQLIDPLGDGSVKVNGTHLHITVPEGATHNVWSDGVNAPRVMQSADNLDFEYIVKFDSQVTQNAQMQGLIIEQDAQNFARFDFEFNNTVKAYAATIADGAARKRFSVDINPADAVYLKITRVVNNWTMSYSGNGIDWTVAGIIKNYVLNVSKAGIFAGNVAPKGAPAPAHTAIIDYFQNVAQGPMPGDAPLLDIQTVGGGTVTTNPPLSQLACGQTVTLTATPGFGWAFGSWSGDASGTQASVSLLLTGPKKVTATFTQTGDGKYYLFLPATLRSND